MPGLRSAIRKKSIGGSTTAAVGGRTTIQPGSSSNSLPGAEFKPLFPRVPGTAPAMGWFVNWRGRIRGSLDQFGLPVPLWSAGQSGQWLDADVPELDWINIAGKSKVARAPVLAWVRMIRQKVGCVA